VVCADIGHRVLAGSPPAPRGLRLAWVLDLCFGFFALSLAAQPLVFEECFSKLEGKVVGNSGFRGVKFADLKKNIIFTRCEWKFFF